MPVWHVFQAIFLGSCVLMAISCIVVTATSFDALSLLLFLLRPALLVGDW
jgi:hypothetical protein